MKHSSKLVHLDIPGGEPFLSGIKQQKELLSKLIQANQAKDISIHYTTNATIWPDNSFWDLWPHFKSIDIQLSIDGTGNRFEYIRHPADWSSVLHHIKQYQYASVKNKWLKLSISHTVSAYNIFYLPEFLNWCKQQKLPKPWLCPVHKPNYMRPGVWPDPARQFIIDHLNSQDQESQTWANLIQNSHDSQYFELFKERLYWHDNYRKTDFKSVFPEMAKFIQ
mgnify:FL=1